MTTHLAYRSLLGDPRSRRSVMDRAAGNCVPTAQIAIAASLWFFEVQIAKASDSIGAIAPSATGTVLVQGSATPTIANFTLAATGLVFNTAGGFPTSIGEMNRAVGGGTWAAGYLFSETASPSVPTFGGTSNFTNASGTAPTYNVAGINAGDAAISLATLTANVQAGSTSDFDIANAGDLLIAMVFKISTVTSHTLITSKSDGNNISDWSIEHDSGAATSKILLFDNLGNSAHADFLLVVGEWMVLIVAVDRGANKIAGSAYAQTSHLLGGRTDITSISASFPGGAQFTNANPFFIGDDTDGTVMQVSAIYFGAGSGVASGAVAALDTWVANLWAYILSAPIHGAASDTIAAITSVATGTVLVQGTAADAIAALTAGGTGAVKVQGSASDTVDPFTVLGTGIAAAQGIAADTIDPITVAATATSKIQGTATPTIDPVTITATGTVKVQGAASPAIDPIVSTATGAVLAQGAAADTIAPITSSATGTIKVQGSASDTIDPVTSTATATAKVQGAAADTIDPLTSGGTGTVLVQGIASDTIAAPSIAATGTVEVQGAAVDTIAPVVAGATGTVLVQGIAADTIDPISANATATAADHGAASPTIDPVTITATGTVTGGPAVIHGSLAVTVDAPTLAATGIAAAHGAASDAIGSVSIAATGAVAVHGTASDTIAPVTPAATGAVLVQGTAADTLASPTIAAQGAVLDTGALAITIDPLTGSATGVVFSATRIGTLDASIGEITSTSSGEVFGPGPKSRRFDYRFGDLVVGRNQIPLLKYLSKVRKLRK